MSYQLYSVEGQIQKFFGTYTDATREECDEWIARRFGRGAEPALLQGSCSYTMITGEKQPRVVQLRASAHLIDPIIHGAAKHNHPEFVPTYRYLGIIGSQQPAHIYEMEKMRGSPYILSRDTTNPQPAAAIEKQRNTVTDLARFFAQAWNKGQYATHENTSALGARFRSNFDLLKNTLPERFQAKLREVDGGQRAILANDYPWVLAPSDLSQTNLLIDDGTGHVTGILDWSQAEFLPFGIALAGIEDVFGWMDKGGWHYFSNHDELKALFWSTFYELTDMEEVHQHWNSIQEARLVGMFFGHGLIYDHNGEVVRGVDDSIVTRIPYLDAFCT